MLYLVAYLAGVLTILSPCILPVLPFVFARADRPFARNGLPMLAGMALTFAAVASLAAVAGGWAVATNEIGRYVALALLAAFGLSLLLPQVTARLTRPFVALGDRLARWAGGPGGSGGAWSSALLGVATGLLWVPCAGPVLGLILTGAALTGPGARTTLLLLTYAAGAATSLGVALVLGGKLFAAMKRSLGAGEWVRRGLGIAVIVAVVAIAAGLDTGYLTKVSAAGTTDLEQELIGRFGVDGPGMAGSERTASGELPVEGPMPSLDGAVEWLNSGPLSTEELRGKVVLVDFWTYSCINCIRAIPYVRAWAEKYADDGLVVIGVHTPEFAFEKRLDNVERAVEDLGIDYPVAVDDDYAIWRAFENRYWPAHYFVDAAGDIRHHRFGEGSYDESERIIQELLAEAGRVGAPTDLVAVDATGAEAPAGSTTVRSPETYVGHERAERFASPEGLVPDASQLYTPGDPQLDEWDLRGVWAVGGEHATLVGPTGSIRFRFHARDLHLVLGPGPDGRPVRFRVTVDGAPPGDDHGVDVDAAGEGLVTGERLYQLVRQDGAVRERTFEIRFDDPRVEAYAFTFG